ncbi:MAG: DMT family transporter [Melioribacteraceae bacterium]
MPLLGEITALITACFWSMSSIAFTEASIRVGPMYVNVTRMLIALIFLSVTLIFLNVKVDLSSNQIWNLTISGFAGLVIGDTFLFKAFRSIGARISMLVMALVPPISALLAFFFLGERLSILGVLGITVTVSGIALVIFKREERPTSNYKIDYSGIFYAVIGAVGQAVGLIFAKYAFNENEINGFLASFVRIASAVIMIYPLVIITKRFREPVKVFMKDKKGFLFTLIGAVFGPYLGITFSLISISHTKVGIASTIMATVPILMLPLVHFYYKEKLSWISITGAFIAVGGVALLFLH